MLSVIMLNVVVLSVVAPNIGVLAGGRLTVDSVTTFQILFASKMTSALGHNDIKLFTDVII
jgi:hypothetical protein